MERWLPTVPFAPFMPDLSSLGTEFGSVAYNVVPQSDGYGPFKSLTDFTRALPARCRGFFFARNADGSIRVFAGTQTRLYTLDNSTFTWTDVSKGGSAYADLVATDNWQFVQFADLVVAVQVNTVPQKYTLSAGGVFADLAGSPPSAGSVAVINQFLVLSNLLSNPRRVQWSDLGAPENWSSGLSDFEDLVDGGVVLGVAGGDAFGLVFQEDLVRSLIYAPGSATTFDIRKLAERETLFARYSIVTAGPLVFYCSAAGFKMVAPGSVPQPIGKDQVDETFLRDVDRGNLQLVLAATDPTRTLVYFGYKSGQGAAELIDKVLIYDIALKRWATLVDQAIEYFAALAKPGLTLEQLDAIAPTPLNVLDAFDNGSGEIRLELDALSNADFNIVGQNFIVVQGVEGTVEANGTWPFTVIDATHIDLVGSVFTNAYVAGGEIGGSLDALPFSLDSISKASVAELAAFTSDHKLGFFDGPNLEATIETAEQDGQGRLISITALRPLTDSAGAMCSVGKRLNAKQSTAVVYSTETAINDDGFCPQTVETRYPRGRIRVPAGDVWSYARGIQPLGGPSGYA